MKKALFYLFLFAIPQLLSAQVYTGDIILADQAAVDYFNIDYPGITYVDGTLTIGVNAYNQNIIEDLSSLNNITGAVTLEIYNCSNFNNWVPTQIQNLTLRYANINPLDNNYDGLPAFTSGLTTLDSLETLIYYYQSVQAIENPVHLFENLLSVNYLNISSSLHISLNTLSVVNEMIYDISGGGKVEFPVLSSLDTLICNGNPNPQDFFTPYLPACSHVNNISIHDPYCYDGLQGLASLTSVGNLYILSAFSISGLSGLVTADTIDIKIEQLNGLYSLQSTGSLDIEFNVPWNQAPVQNLIALNSLQTVNSLFIRGEIAGIEGINNLQINEYLHLEGEGISYCSYPSICVFIENHNPEDYYISENNGFGCSSAEEITASCDPSVSSIFGELFFDTNCNGTFDQNEFNIPPSYIQLETSGEIFYSTEQFMAVTPPLTEATFNSVGLPDYLTPINPITITTAESGALNPLLIIPVCAAYDFSDLQISVLQTGNLSPGFQSYWKVQVTNQGTNTVDFIPSYTINTTEFVASINSFSGSLNDYTITI
jgi:hypothetical protein